VCYRRHGHNEADEPSITQPLMYQVIRQHKTTRELYAAQLEAAGVIAIGAGSALADAYRNKLDSGECTTDVVQAEKLTAQDPLFVDWPTLLAGKLSDAISTAVGMDKLKALATQINNVPADVQLHSRVAKVYDDRRKMAAGEQPGDWGFAENLAYATLVDEGFALRLVGQDVGRGTFTHRHAILHDQKTDSYYLPLRQLTDKPERVAVVDSLLSEEAVMAYEYGFSTTDPNTLCIWEGQFGDFANGAQVVIDQFVAAGEAKWGRISGLTLLLPHGYEGQGPEHSSARLERFLQLCALDNMLVCVPSTPAQAFHMLRRQLHMTTRKPLVVMSPKSLLRHKLAVSSLDELANGQFQRLIPDTTATANKVKRVVLCSGKVYYDLLEAVQKQAITDVALVRVEQLYPFPRTELTAELKRFAAATEIIWCQEEPQNQGAWYQIQHHLRACLQPKQALAYAGRPSSPSPAVGHMADHLRELQEFLAAALSNPFSSDLHAD
jgi:2-oxoglutarate dehydrogenase E1 component